MNKKSTLWLTTLTLLSLILTSLLILIYQSEKNKNYTFDAVVLEVYNEAVLLEPINSTFLNYDRVYAPNIIGVSEGERLNVKITKEVREVYPPIIEVISYEIYRG